MGGKFCYTCFVREIEIKLKAENSEALELLGLSEGDEQTKGYDTQIYELESKSS